MRQHQGRTIGSPSCLLFLLSKRPFQKRLGREANQLQQEDGASLIEVSVSMAVFLSLILGVIQILMALYAYNFVSDAAREGTRYAVIRGEDSCYPNPSFPNCNLQPSSIKSNTNPDANPVLSYVDSFRYPGLDQKNLSAVVTWWVANQTPNGHTSWTTPCTGKVDDKGNACNAEGNAVRVVVTYSFPLSIPWMHKSIAKVSSTSQMVINF
jgi:hypothetical protein